MPRVPFALHSYVLDSLPASAQRLINLYAEALPPNSRSEAMVRHVPGLVSWASLDGSGKVWDVVQLGDYLYAIGGFANGDIYKVTSAGTDTLIDSIAGLDRSIHMAASATQIVIVNPPDAFVLEADVLTQITDPDFPNVLSVAYVGGFFVFAVEGGQQYIISGLLDATTYSALDFSSAETVPDGLLWVAELDNELWLFGARSIEIHLNTGADFPFERQSGGVIDIGTIAGLTVRKLDGSLFWLGSDLKVYRSRGYEKERISTHAIEKEIERFVQPELAGAFAYTYQGHDCYVLGFPSTYTANTTPGRTYIYDCSTKLWHERSTADAGGSPSYWNAACAVRFGRRMLIGSGEGGAALSYMDGTIATENGSGLTAIATLPPLWADAGLAFVHRLELEMETGANASEMDVTMQYSDDGGLNFSPALTRATGTSGDGHKRVVWLRNGRFRKRIYKFTFESGSEISLFGADVHTTATTG